MTLVIDASAVAELLLTPRGKAVEAVVGTEPLVAPELLSVEVLSVLRGWVRAGGLTPQRAERALERYAELGVDLVPMQGLLRGAWRWCGQCSAYDAMYVALAQAARGRLVTCDARLARACPDVALLVGEG